MFTVSGLRVRFLKVYMHMHTVTSKNFSTNVCEFSSNFTITNFLQVWEKSGYNTVEWVRYITKAGSYEIRC